MMTAVFLLAQTSMSFATTTAKSFSLTANVPAASSININPSRVNADGSTTALATTNLSFDTMTFDPTYSIFRPDHGFVIDVSAVGAGAVTTVVTYVEGNKPTGALKALGAASYVTFVKAVNAATPEVKLSQLALTGLNQTITPAQISGGYLRAYLAVSVGDVSKEPAGVAPFSSADKTGTYDGTITFTVTVV